MEDAKARGAPTRSARPAKRTFKESQELRDLPARIEALEAEQATLSARLTDPELYRSDPAEVRRIRTRFEQIEEELLVALDRWTALEAKTS